MQKELLKCLILDQQTTTMKEARKKLDMMTQSPSDGWLPRPLKIAYTLRLLMWLDHLSQQVFLWPTWFPKFLHSVVIWSDSVGDIHLCEGTICRNARYGSPE